MSWAPTVLGERRRHARVKPVECSPPARVRLRPGREGQLVNLSRGGACVDTSSRLLPGTPIDVQLLASGWQWTGEARVVRCLVAALPREEKVRYRAGLQFATPIDTDLGPVREAESFGSRG